MPPTSMYFRPFIGVTISLKNCRGPSCKIIVHHNITTNQDHETWQTPESQLVASQHVLECPQNILDVQKRATFRKERIPKRGCGQIPNLSTF